MKNKKEFTPNKTQNRNKRVSKSDDFKKETSHIPGHNDWRWYAPSEQIAKDLANLPFNKMAGTQWGIKDLSSADKTYSNSPANVISFSYVLYTGGLAPSASDGLNMAAKQLYTAVRKSNSGAKVYEAADLMMYILAMREVYAVYFSLKRALGLIKTYSFINRSLPRGILKALGYDNTAIDDMIANYAVYRGKLNLLAAKINSFAVPKYFKVFMRDAFIASYVFSDSTALDGQFYVYTLEHARTWSAKVQGGSALLCDRGIEGEDMPAQLSTLDSMLTALFDDTDINTMAGDIVKAFGDSGLYQVEEIGEDYTVVPIYDEDVLNQINNLTLIDAIGHVQDTESDLSITQNPDTQLIESALIVALPKSSVRLSDYIFNSHKNTPEYTDILEWSRMYQMLVYDRDHDTEGTAYYRVIAGAELVTSMTICNYSNSSTHMFLTTILTNRPRSGDVEIMNFDWHPILYYVYSDDETILFGGDTKHATTISTESVSSLHSSAIYSLFYSNTLFADTK